MNLPSFTKLKGQQGILFVVPTTSPAEDITNEKTSEGMKYPLSDITQTSHKSGYLESPATGKRK